MTTSRAIAEYHDFLAYVLIYAPADFPAEDYLQAHEQMTLEKAFSRLARDLNVVKSRVADKLTMRVLEELLAMSLEAYESGQDVRAAHILQEFEGLIWPKHRQQLEFLPEAEARLRRTPRDA